jgi:hypothetical protein
VSDPLFAAAAQVAEAGVAQQLAELLDRPRGALAGEAVLDPKPVSGGIASSACASSCNRNSVVPERGAPTMNGAGASITESSFAGRRTGGSGRVAGSGR